MTQEQFKKASPYINTINNLQEQIKEVEAALSFPKGVMMVISLFAKIRIKDLSGKDIVVYNFPSRKLIRELLEKHLQCLKEEEAEWIEKLKEI